MTTAYPAASVRLPTEALDQTLRRLLAAVRAHSDQAYLVGGAVRDLLRGARPADLDIVLAGDVHAIAEDLASTLNGHLFALDTERGQYRVVLGDGHIHEIDLSPLAGTIEADLSRRDFTVNAMATPIEEDGTLGEVIDPYDGRDDLAAKRLRMVSEQVLIDDPLRLLRAVRFAVELQFEIEPETSTSIERLAARIHQAAAERQQAELMRIFAAPRSAAGVRLLDSLGLLTELLPEVTAGRGISQPVTHHYWDVFDHSVETLASLDSLLSDPTHTDPKRPWFQASLRESLAWFPFNAYLDEKVGAYSRRALLKIAGLLHDVGKPETKGVDADGHTHFFGHCELGAEKATRIGRRLRLGNRETEFVSLLVEEHLRPTQLSDRRTPPSQRALYRFRRDLGEAVPACLILMLADSAAAVGPPLKQESWQRRVAYVSYVLQQIESQSQAAAQTPRLVTGHDLMAALNLPPGPELGRLLDAVNEAIGAGEITTREAAIEYARQRTSPPNPLSVHGEGELNSRAAETGAGTVELSKRPELGAQPSSPGSLSEHGEGVATAGGEVSPTRQLSTWLTPGNPWERLKPVAREMRHASTEAEERLWQSLRRKQLGIQFRRQHPLGRFIVDFYCSAAKLIVEVDGPIHQSTTEADALRTGLLEAQGFRVLRFTNDQVLTHLASVLDKIRAGLAGASHE